MRVYLKLFFLAVCLLGGNVVLATPEADAAYAARRFFKPAQLKVVEEKIKDALVTAYYRPLSELGIDLIDRERFFDLIPDDDVAHYIDRILELSAEKYLSIYTPEKLASVANRLRTDSELTTKDVLNEPMQQKYLIALEEARKQATTSGSEPSELVLQLKAFTATYGDERFKGFNNIVVAYLASLNAPFMAPVRLSQDALNAIEGLEPDLDHPTILLVLREDGIFRFVNPVQQQTLIRQLEPKKSVGGITFQKPPKK